MRGLVLVGVVCVVGGCASSGATPRISRGGEHIVGVQTGAGGISTVEVQTDDQTRTATLIMDYSVAWDRLPELLTEIGLSVGTIDEAQGRVAHRGERLRRIDGKRLSTYLDCGIGSTAQPYANVYDVVMGYEVVLRRGQDGSVSSAQMTIEASARPMATSGNPLRCTSEGTLERLVFQRLQAAG